MFNLGFLLAGLDASQETFCLVKQANNCVEKGDSIVIFEETPNVPCVPNLCCTMQLNEAYSFQHPLIATRLTLAKKLLTFPGTREKFFYLWDLEWLRYPSQAKNYHAFAQVYRNTKLKLIVRSEYHKYVVEDCWNVSVAGIVEDYNIKQFTEIINAEEVKQGILAA